ncbi:MAG: glycosyltransferase family 4 protein [Clostridia bacterium]|nr:glycosyltransferase family 4 protein [Clostridia bacterium]
MKIAMIGHKRVPSRSGGIEVVVEELATRMAARGHEVDIYNRHSGEEKLRTYKGTNIIEIPTVNVPALHALLSSLFATVKSLFKTYDVVHYHAEGPCAMIPLAKLFGKKTVATIHGLDWQRSKWGGFATKYLLFGEKMAAKHADRVIVLSENVKKYFKDKYDCDAVLIPNGINRVSPVAPDIIREKYGLCGGDYILFLARITPEKGLDYLIDAYKALDTDKKLVIAGALTPKTDYIASVKEKTKDCDNIIFTDFAGGQTLAELFSNCYVYVLPSDIEGMPMSLLEAVGYDARVIVSDIPENVDCLDGYGNSFAHGDSDALRRLLADCLAHEELRPCDFKADKTPQDVQAERRNLLLRYDWDAITTATLDLYAGLKKQKKK